MSDGWMLVAITLLLVHAAICVVIATIKNRSSAGWAIASAAIPLIALFAISVLPELDRRGRPKL